MCGHLRQARGWKRRKMRGGSHSLLPLLNITCNEKEINCLRAGRCAIMIPMTWVMRTPIPCMLLNDRDPCRCSKHVIHDQAAVEVIVHALVWIARCLQPQMRLYFGRLQQLPSLQGLTGGQDIPRFLLSLIPGLFFLPPTPFFPAYHPRRRAASQIMFFLILHHILTFFPGAQTICAPERKKINYASCLLFQHCLVRSYFKFPLLLPFHTRFRVWEAALEQLITF